MEIGLTLGEPSLELLPHQEHVFGRPRSGPRALLVVSKDEEELWTGLLSREGTQWMLAESASAFDAAVETSPGLVVLEAASADDTVRLIRRLRRDPATRAVGIVVRRRRGDAEDEAAFSSAGANVVLGPVVAPRAWQCRLHELLRVPQRRALRLPVRLSLRPAEAKDPGFDGRLLNLSTHGVLLECGRPLAIGDKLDVSFRLPGDDDPLQAVGQIVRKAPAVGYGVKFLLLRADARERIAAAVEERRRAAR